MGDPAHPLWKRKSTSDSFIQIGKKVCILYTCGLRYRDYAKPAARLLARQGARYAGNFGCRGFDTYGVLKKIGGIAKGHPNQADLDSATAFAAAVVGDCIP